MLINAIRASDEELLIPASGDSELHIGQIAGDEEMGVFTGFEAPSPAPGAGIGGGGGAGAGVILEKEGFLIEPELIKVHLKQGETQTKIFKIKNIGNMTSDYTIKTDFKYILISETEFSLNPNEEKTITLDFSANSDQDPELYMGKILVKTRTLTKIVRIIMEVESKKALFDIQVTIPFTSKIIPIAEGMQSIANILIKNFGDIELMDINLHYAIKDMDGNVITAKEETMAIKKSLLILRSLMMPVGTPEGDYIFYAKVSYGDAVAISSDIFELKKSSLLFNRFTIPVIGSAILIIILIFILRSIYLIKFKLHRSLMKIERALKKNDVEMAIKLYKYMEKDYEKLDSASKVKLYPIIKKTFREIKELDTKRKKILSKKKVSANLTTSRLLKKIENNIKGKRIDLAIINYNKLNDYYKNLKDGIKVYVYPKIQKTFERIEIKRGGKKWQTLKKSKK